MGDLLGLLGQSNPLAQVTRSFGQFQKGLDDFLRLVEQFGSTMEQMSRIAERVNTLLDDVEPPIRALMPQVTRTIKAGDVIVDRMGSAVDLLGELAKGLQPLAQLAENAGGLLGLKNLPSLRGASPGDLVRRASQLASFADLGASSAGNAEQSGAAHPTAAARPQARAAEAPAKKAAAKRAAAKKATAKRAAATKTTPTKTTPTKAAAPKATPKKASSSTTRATT